MKIEVFVAETGDVSVVVGAPDGLFNSKRHLYAGPMDGGLAAIKAHVEEERVRAAEARRKYEERQEFERQEEARIKAEFAGDQKSASALDYRV